MNTNDLNLFEAVAQHGSFTKAAEEMFTVQSNVTARIKSLEEEFGTLLFDRSSRKVRLTPAGETLMVYSKKLNQLIDEAKRSVGNTEELKGQVKIGALETMMATKGPELVNRLASKFPFIDLEFTSAMPRSLISDVVNYRLDAAFVPAPLNVPELDQIWISDEEVVAVVPEDCKNIAELLKRNPLKAIVFDQGCVFRARLESWLVSKGVSQYHKTVMNSIEGVVNFIESGIGFSFLPKEIISTFYGNRKVRTLSLPRELALMTTVLTFRRDVPLSPTLKAFISLYDRTEKNRFLDPNKLNKSS
ncbi:LysR family transcriptional regulator [Pedobacter sp. Leaf41]|jgi:DNA-binding transcriptional LysR family regulator|uniref:LysR family transcriptional regulator n=1 Tax=Pedobacter sp. Leaf41 TaxID=1736218 RepID=UPI000703A3C5|nr:LysR family transcriptional regulator [Pedobacter sp. Leaf41]KQN36274.1 LysR family transcriptional regulator [Pedobacter sp. Leaf41]RZJ75554.1 MAG: LysR family transcriptional regulator [Flavobacterium sp.]